MKNTLDKIYREAFKLFMTKHYELVTIRDLEKAIGMTRGAIFYYVKDKEDLFRKVIDRYFLENQNLYYKIDCNNSNCATLKEFISQYIKGIDKVAKQVYTLTIGSMKKKSQMPVIDRSYLSLILNIGYYYPEFNKKMSEIFNVELKEWEIFINKAINTGEIKKSLEPSIIAKQFHFIFHGLAFNNSLGTGINIKDLKILYMNLYNLIKV